MKCSDIASRDKYVISTDVFHRKYAEDSGNEVNIQSRCKAQEALNYLTELLRVDMAES